jgi:putative component of toxin-antitoxin plasmid stabilization module
MRSLKTPSKFRGFCLGQTFGVAGRAIDKSNTYGTIDRGALPAAKEYVDARRISPFHKWFIDLHAPEAAKVTGAIIRMEQGNFGNVKGVGSGVFESVLNFGPVIAFTSAKMATRSSFCLGVERKGGSRTTLVWQF